jgi:hypothetical protein
MLDAYKKQACAQASAGLFLLLVFCGKEEKGSGFY